ncbi:MAG: dockerin type I domain-containing protein [Ruminococcus sp.]|nr:dockerin type I domain-containing protein [Ruminococcus sp.]
MDGVVTGHDTAMVSRYVLDDTYTLTEEQLKLADVNEDGTVDQADADKLYTEMQVYPLGDVDMNGNAGVSDAVDILTYCAKVSAGQSMELTAVQKNLTDVDLNGKISVDDACYVLHGYARRAASFAYIYSENTNQYYYDPIKIVFIDRNDPDFMQDYMDGKYDDADVTVPKTNA